MNETPDLKEQLSFLVQLQLIDSELKNLNDDRGELPTQIEQQKKEINRTKQMLVASQQALDRMAERRITLTHEVEEARTRKRKLEDSLYSVTSNREYDALTRELEDVQKQLGRWAEESQQVHNDIEKHEAEHAKIDLLIKKQESELENLQKELNEIVEDTTEMETELIDRRKNLEGNVIRPIYNHYERIRQARDGRGIAWLLGGSCGGCYNSVPAQKQVEVRTYKDFILCEACGRVLVSDELKG